MTKALQYLGVEAENPSTLVIQNRQPQQSDNDLRVGTRWLIRAFDPPELWVLADLRVQNGNRIADWRQIYPSAGGTGSLQNLIADGPAGNESVPVNNGEIEVTGGAGMATSHTAGNQMSIGFSATAGAAIATAVGGPVGRVLAAGLGFVPVTSPGNEIARNTTPTSIEQFVNDGNLANFSRQINTDINSPATPSANNVIELLGGLNIETEATGGNQITIRTPDALNLPDTTGANTGTLRIDGLPHFHAYLPGNTFVGRDSGNFSLTGTNHTMLGANTGISLTTGVRNTGIGAGSLTNVTSGSNNIALGGISGSTYTSESLNIVIGNQGTAGDNNTIRIGDSNYNRFFASGVYQATLTGGNNLETVIMDDQGQLSTSPSGAASTVVSTVNVDNNDSVTADTNNEISILGGQNINSERTSANEITIGTTDTINLPQTTGANTGVYSIANERFLHLGGGLTNTYVGTRAGSFDTSTRNVGVGYEVLTNINGGIRNTAVGQSSLSGLVSGGFNACFGDDAGLNYNGSESNNITIRNPGTQGENNTIRIGRQTNQLRAFIAGIHDVTPQGSNIQTVTIDDQGQLGSTASTGGGSGNTVAFFAYLDQDVTSNARLGAARALTVRYDIGGNTNPGGNGTPFSFTAPTAGRYLFSFQGTTTQATGIMGQVALIIQRNNANAVGAQRTRMSPTTTTEQRSYCMTTTLNLNAGDVITFGMRINPEGAGFGPGYSGDNVPIGTWVSGHQV